MRALGNDRRASDDLSSLLATIADPQETQQRIIEIRDAEDKAHTAQAAANQSISELEERQTTFAQEKSEHEAQVQKDKNNHDLREEKIAAAELKLQGAIAAIDEKKAQLRNCELSIGSYLEASEPIINAAVKDISDRIRGMVKQTKKAARLK